MVATKSVLIIYKISLSNDSNEEVWVKSNFESTLDHRWLKSYLCYHYSSLNNVLYVNPRCSFIWPACVVKHPENR